MSTSPNLDASARMKEPVCAPVHSPKPYFSIGPSSHAPSPFVAVQDRFQPRLSPL